MKQSLAKDIKLSSYLGGNLSSFHFYFSRGFCLIECVLNSLVGRVFLLEFICNLCNHILLNFKIMKLE